MDPSPLAHLAGTVAFWERRADDQRALGRRNWAAAPRWGVFEIPETRAGVLPADLGGRRVIELGCGTAYVSAWLARRGARPVAVDPTAGQLVIAAELQRAFGERFPLVQAPAERLPFANDTFDVAISEYGAAIWADPRHWIPEAARVLRPGGELVFLGTSALAVLCVPDTEDVTPAGPVLVRQQFGMHRLTWCDGVVEFHLSHGDMIRLLRATGFEVLDLVELRPEEDAVTSYGFTTTEWARRWPWEEVWRARLAH